MSAPSAIAAPSSPSLATAATHRILAWPRYDRAADLEALCKGFGPALLDGNDVCLCLRHDRTQDIPLDEAARAVESAFSRALGPEAALEVLIVDDSLDDAGWVALGQSVTGVIALPSSQEPGRASRLGALGHPLINSPEELRRCLEPSSSAFPFAPRPPRLSTPTSSPSAARSGQPLVSVIIPTFNRPEFLQRALGSLTRQTFRDFEVVIVNDGGAAIEELVQTFTPALSIAYVRHSANRDRAAARNSAFGVARGRYIAYLDDDDCFRPEHLQTLVDALAQGTHKVAYSDATWVLEEKAGSGYRTVRPLLTRSKPFDRGELMIGSYIPILSVMHERACLDVVGAFDETLAAQEDWDLCIRLASAYDFLHVARVTADISWRDDGEGTSSAKSAELVKTTAFVHQRYRSLVTDPMIAAQQGLISGAAKPAWLTTPLASAPAASPAPAPAPAIATASAAHVPVTAAPPRNDDVDPAYEQFVTQLVATYSHPSFAVTKYQYGDWEARRAQAAKAALDQRFDNDRAVIMRHLLATAASPTVALEPGNLASAVLQAIELISAAPLVGGSGSGSLEQRVEDALAKVPAPVRTVTSKRASGAPGSGVSSSERAALVEKILDQVIDVALVPRFNDYDHLDDIVAIVRSRYAGPVDKHRARSEAVLRALSVLAAGDASLTAAELPRALRGLLGPGHPYVPHRGSTAPPQIRTTLGDLLDELNNLKAEDNPRRFLEINREYSMRQRGLRQQTSDTNPWGLSILGEYEENHHMLLRALCDLRRSGRLTADDEVLVVGSRYADELAFFRKHLGLPRTIGLDLFDDPAGGIVGGDMHDMSFATGRFSLIYCAGTLCYSYNMRRAIAEFARVLRRPGFMILSDSADRLGGVDPLGRSDSGGIDGFVGFFHEYPYRIIGQDPGRSCTPAAVTRWPCLAIELLPE
ncbi:MAG TPA: glycosyltransferase [Polyangia bacterium]|nr:glycosyltransferase [Polyangia bacterium]